MAMTMAGDTLLFWKEERWVLSECFHVWIIQLNKHVISKFIDEDRVVVHYLWTIFLFNSNISIIL